MKTYIVVNWNGDFYNIHENNWGSFRGVTFLDTYEMYELVSSIKGDTYELFEVIKTGFTTVSFETEIRNFLKNQIMMMDGTKTSYKLVKNMTELDVANVMTILAKKYKEGQYFTKIEFSDIEYET